MTTKKSILLTGDDLIRTKGYNAFSFVDISQVVGIQKPSIHHHFPRKADLGVAVIEYHLQNLYALQQQLAGESPLKKLEHFFAIYTEIKAGNKVCLVGSLATDYNTLDVQIQEKLRLFSETMLNWVTGFLEEGRNTGVFEYTENSRTKAILIISNMLAIVQLSRVTDDNDFYVIKESIQQTLIKK